MNNPSITALLCATDAIGWNQALDCFPDKDVYFHREYAMCYEGVDSGISHAFFYSDGHNDFFFPFRMRTVDIPGFEGFHDVTSDYGYGGPLCNTSNKLFIERAYNAWNRFALDNKVLCEFVRYHPLIQNHCIAEAHRDLEFCCETVYMESISDESVLMQSISKKLRRDYNKSMRLGTTVRKAKSSEDIKAFWQVYTSTMHYARTRDYYFFKEVFFKQTLNILDSHAFILLAELDGALVAGAMFLYGETFMHYHFSGMDRNHPKAGAACGTTVLLIEAFKIAHLMGLKKFHLGGGVGGQEDPLFRFKSRFSTHRGRFFVSKHLFDEVRYNAVCEAARVDPKCNFFPAYRAAE